MNQGYQRIILATDALQPSDAASESAFNLARQNDAKVTIVDTLRPPSASTRWFSSNADDVFEMVVADKRSRLEKMASGFRDSGIDAQCKLLFGKSSESITREVIDSNASLVVRYMKGLRSRFPGFFGNTARNLMRICPCPVLLAGTRAIESPRVLACVNAEHESPENEAILDESRRLAGNHENLQALYCWKFFGEEFLKDYMADDLYQQTLAESRSVYRDVFESFCMTHDLSSFEDRFHFECGDPVELIPHVCRHEKIDVVVMSSASQTHPIRRLLGSTIESVLDELPCALLVVKPPGFKSPVKGSNPALEIGN